jgi:predicted DNA-binding WGR domain protein
MLPKMTLTRVVNNRIRYYQITLGANLFGEYVIDRVYGSMNNKRPTGVIKEYCTSLQDANSKIKTIVHQKQQKGYR